MSQSQTDSHVQETPGEITESEKLECTGAQCENQHPVDEHNNTHCAHRSVHMGNN